MPLYPRWQSKPWPGVGIDWSHPLSQKLSVCCAFNEGSGSPAELLSGNTLAAVSTAGTWTSSPFGTAFTSPSAGHFTCPGPVSYSAYTLIFIGTVTVPTRNDAGRLVCTSDANNNGLCLAYNHQASSPDTLHGLAGGVSWFDSGIQVPTTAPVCLAFTGSSDLSKALQFYMRRYDTGAVSVSSQTGTGTAVNGSGSACFAGQTGKENDSSDQFVLGLIASRIWSLSEIDSFAANPWQIFQPQAGWLFNAAAAGGTQTYYLWPGEEEEVFNVLTY